MTNQMPSLQTIVRHWIAAAGETFPDLCANWIGWGEPFCFRCGWLAPVPTDAKRAKVWSVWQHATGWLERAHLHDRSAGGSYDPSNIVPLCGFCHRAMPDFPDGPERAIAWVQQGQPTTVRTWWQLATDSRWGGDRYEPFPGWVALQKFRFVLEERIRELDAGPAAIT